MALVKLKNSGSLIELSGIRQVAKASNCSGSYRCSSRFINITYVDGNTITINYGYDENYYNEYNPKLDEDFKQIEVLLGVDGL